MLTTPSRERSSSHKRPKTQVHTFSSLSSEAYEADDICFQVLMALRLMLAHPAAALATNISPTCPNVSATKRVCTRPIGTHQLHCIVCKSGGGVDQRHSVLARCLADLITTHTGAKVHIEQTIPGLPREPHHGAQPAGARTDIVFNLHGQTHYIDTAVVTPFSANVGLIAAESTRPGYMAKREEKKKFDRYPRINLVPFILETTGTTGIPRPKSSPNTCSATQTTHPTAIRDAWAAIQTTLHGCISRQQLRAVTT